MIPVSNEYRRQLIAGNRNWVIKVPVFLNGNVSGTPDFTLTNEHIWDNGIVIDNAISNDNSFDIGAAIVGSLKVVIDNINGDYSLYDFYGAKLTLWLGVTGDLDENDDQIYYRIGFYVVDQPDYNGSLITLNCLDNMTWFDVPFEGITTTSTTAGAIVQAICTHVGVFLATPQFPNYTTQIDVELTQTLNCREVLQYIAQICCCYCKIDRAGELALKWYNKQEIIGITDYDGGSFSTNTTPYSDGCDLDGGTFDPWSQGDNADGGLFTDLLDSVFLSQNFDISVSTDDIVVTGCRVRKTSSSDDAYDELWVDSTIEQTHERYVLVIENNPFITNATQANAIATNVGSILAGLPIRGFKSTSLADFSYETGDMATVIDFRGNRYYTWLTHLTFTTNNSETFNCGVESLRKRSEERYSQAIQTLAEANDNANAMLSEYDNAQAAMNELAQNALDYYVYEHTVTGSGKTTWLYNAQPVDTTTYSAENPRFPNATTVIKITGDGLFLSSDHGDTYTAGLDANSGTAILNMIFAHGIQCDWVKTGTLTLGGYDDVNGLCKVFDATDPSNERVRLDNTGLYAVKGNIGGFEITSTALGNKIGSSSCVGMISNDKLFTWSTSGHVDIYTSGRLDVTGNSIHVIDNPNNEMAISHENIYCDAHGNVEWQGSDRKLKKNIKDLTLKDAKSLIDSVRPRKYEFKSEEGKRYGFVAQELIDVLPDDSRIAYEENDLCNIHYIDFIAPLCLLVKNQQEELDLLKQEMALLKKKVGE